MAYKSREDQREYGRRHYQENKEAYKARAKISNKLRVEKLRQFVRELKEATPCTDCGESYPYYVMDFDHISEKNALITTLVFQGRKRRLMEEIALCEIVCSNCHRSRTHARLSKSA